LATLSNIDFESNEFNIYPTIQWEFQNKFRKIQMKKYSVYVFSIRTKKFLKSIYIINTLLLLSTTLQKGVYLVKITTDTKIITKLIVN
jgi:hypothetical protein